MKRRLKGTVFIVIGLILVLSALILIGYNIFTEKQAANATTGALEVLQEDIIDVQKNDDIFGTTQQNLPDYVLHPDMEMPTKNIDGWDYIGVLEIPELGLSLPIITEWSYPALKISPARYSGSVYTNNLVIAAHNYNVHFGRLKDLKAGAEIQFTDMDGNVFSYEVVAVETLMPTAVEEMTNGEWDLSLFTCTIGGSYRVTVRCESK